MASRTATPWGPADLVEELTLRQQAGGRRFASVVQLLETQKEERLVRFAYSTDGVARRGPVTLRKRPFESMSGITGHGQVPDHTGTTPGRQETRSLV